MVSKVKGIFCWSVGSTYQVLVARDFFHRAAVFSVELLNCNDNLELLASSGMIGGKI